MVTTADKKSVGKKIGQYLVDNGINRTHISNKTGLTYQQVVDICKGKRKVEAGEYLSICEVLGKDPDFFYTYGKEVVE